METTVCCKDRIYLTNNTINTLNVTCCCKCGCAAEGGKPVPPTPEQPEPEEPTPEPPAEEYKIMTVKVDLSDSNPATCCSYADDAVGMESGTVAWDEFFGHYPVMFKEGKEVGKLNPNDFTKFVDGTAADITSGAAGDVMIAFPRRGLKIETVGDFMTVSMTDDPDAEGFEYLAHVRGDERREVFYLGAYKGFKDAESKLRSLSGKMPTASQTIGTFRAQAQANGVGYENSGFYQVTYRQVMYLLKYANLNSQALVGKGYVNGTSSIMTGGTEMKSMNWGEATGKQHMKLFGIEDMWGNIFEWVDGAVTNAVGKILTGTGLFNDLGNGYSDQGKISTSNFYGFMTRPQGSSMTGFLPKEIGGSATTFFCDVCRFSLSFVSCYGGDWRNVDNVGIFLLDMADAKAVVTHVGARLMYL